ncbi:MAG: hotdog fold thioesterase, partial [Pseudomonadota bacterium]
RGTLVDVMGIEYTEVGDNFLRGRMPAERRNFQPAGIVHGGASVVLAESLGSCAAAFTVDLATQRVVGQEINANHIRSVTQGWVTGTARPIHLGRRSQIWGIEMVDDRGKLTCISRLTIAVVEA